MGSLSPIHWIVVLIIVLLLFGPSRLAGLGKGLGEGMRALKKGLAGDLHDGKEDPKRP
jgi:sec-independent protein translocase protein TatA